MQQHKVVSVTTRVADPGLGHPNLHSKDNLSRAAGRNSSSPSSAIITSDVPWVEIRRFGDRGLSPSPRTEQRHILCVKGSPSHLF